MVRHAHAKEEKQARHDAILGAALVLFLQDTRQLPVVAAIAAQAGLAKGTGYLYFETKEQIFADLLSREWEVLFARVEASFTDRSGSRRVVVGRFIDGFAGFLATHPYFLRLDSLGYGQLEANLPPDAFWRSKQEFAAMLYRAGKAVDTRLSLASGHGVQLLVRSYALVRGLWQTLDLPDRLRSDPRFGDHPLAGMDFDAELRGALDEYWRGALT